LRRRPQVAPLILTFVGLAIAVCLVFFLPELTGSSSGDSEQDDGASARPSAGSAGGGVVSGPRALPVMTIPAPEVVRPQQGAHTASTVLWPLRVELELLQAAYLPKDENTPPIGSGASARLKGRIGAPDGGFLRARVEFEAGPNVGRVLHSDDVGRFGATNLYPGLNIVKITAPGVGVARRELRTRQARDTQLNMGFGRLSNVMALVQDSTGKGIEGALVDLDGKVQRSGPNGIVRFSSVTAGRVLVEVEADGYTAHKELVGVTSNHDLGFPLPTTENPLPDKPILRFTLRSTGSLQVTVQPNIGTGPVQLFVLPSKMNRRSISGSIAANGGFPWHRINPIMTQVGVQTQIDGLPAESVRIYAFRSGAKATMRSATIQEGQPCQKVIQLETVPKVSGRVTLDGKPIAGARVRLEAPNRVRATLAYFGETSAFLESAVLPELPSAVQELTTKANGHFSFTAWADMSSTRYLEAVGPDGKTWAGVFVRKGVSEMNLELKELETAGAILAIDPLGRFQGLPVEIFIDGQPQDPFTLPNNELLILKGLREGRWSLKVTWHGEFVHSEDDLNLARGRRTIEVDLIDAAIHGQGEEAWTRAGRTFPFE
jgi:hypothetical protein